MTMNAEQIDELEALEAIYGDDFRRVSSSSSSSQPPTCEVVLKPGGAQEEAEEDDAVALLLRVTFSPNYPETPPAAVTLTPVRGRGALLSDDAIEYLAAQLREAAGSDELLGTAMVYMLAEKCSEWLRDAVEAEANEQQQQREKEEEETATSSAAAAPLDEDALAELFVQQQLALGAALDEEEAEVAAANAAEGGFTFTPSTGKYGQRARHFDAEATDDAVNGVEIVSGASFHPPKSGPSEEFQAHVATVHSMGQVN